ncbi:hypothetical protein PQ478_08640 [Alkalihalophilus pseudofirmus]|uniref:hypothetical protein n=1 Tax=Alkalihalophilus pseudofirmus TaxID=79885 RepID=UPI00259AF621|nr:hypothetical protein [Alkalihalophilus pseudofirmus]WEG18536.1 hypothetical protein PQ478_08640 [Alkalihalophilus pseudofirmus]
MTICTRCGSSLKNPVNFEGKAYGSDCVQVVSGLKRWEVDSAGNDLDSYIIKKAARIKKAQDEHKAATEKAAYYTDKNNWLMSVLESMADPSKVNYNTFAADILRLLYTREVKELSEKQLLILEDMFASGQSGIEEGKVRLSFLLACELYDINDKAVQEEAKIFILSYATLQELKGLCKENKIKGYSKLKREELEELLVNHIEL